MQISDNLFFIVMYSIPAAFYILYNKSWRMVPRKATDSSYELAECLFFAGETFILTLMIGYSFLQSYTGYSFYLCYALVNLISCIAAVFLNFLVKKIFLKIKNILNTHNNRPEETKFQSAWAMAFESNEVIDINRNPAIAIFKSGELITAGIVRSFPSPTHPDRDFLLHSTDRFKEIFEEDKDKPVNERIFPCSAAEYYDAGTDLLIKFYDLEKYDLIEDF